MEAKDQWAGEFGNSYLERNRVDWQARIPFWNGILLQTGARSVFEFGCNAGWNLSAIKRVFPDVLSSGCDINENAIRKANDAGLHVRYEVVHSAELTFTAGVLIHIPPEDLRLVMQSIVDASTDYVLAVEYESEVEEEVNYRGNDGMLWKRPYGKLYEEMGLTLIDKEENAQGFDKCTAWLFRK